MNIEISPLTKLLLPLDGDKSYQRTTKLAGYLARCLDSRVEQITLLHVMAGKYLSQHMANIDFRVDFVLDSETFRRLKEQYIEKEVRSFLNAAEESLKKLQVQSEITQKIVDGNPVDKILQESREGGYSTIIMERRGLSPVQQVFMGSVSSGILHRDIRSSVYLAGKSLDTKSEYSMTKILICVDGSDESARAIKEAALLVKHAGENVKEISVLNVIDVARYSETTSSSGTSLEKETQDILDDAASKLTYEGISSSIITKEAKYGNPVEVISEFVENKSPDLIFIGRKGRSAMKEIFMGSVSRGIIQHCQDQTVAVIP